MNVASLELCKELYELSGWKATDKWWFHEDSFPDLAEWEITRHDMSGKALPAYDLGYLLRKLPHDAAISRSYLKPDMWTAFSSDIRWEHDSPEDAACKLAIELFKKNVLVKEA